MDLIATLGLSVPVIQAPMAGGGDTVELVAAVSAAGALGCIGAAYLTANGISERARAVRALTSRPFGINLFAPLAQTQATGDAIAAGVQAVAPYHAELGLPAPEPPKLNSPSIDDQVEACLESSAAVFSFTFGMFPPETIRRFRDRGIVVAGTATTVAEAQALVEAGVDAVVAQGSEAGGHRGTFATDFISGLIGGIALIPQIADAVRVPVIASGGIMDGRGVAAALVLGATAVQLGTAFLTCDEAGVALSYKDALVNAAEDQTKLTRAFSGRPARGIANRVLRDFEAHGELILPFPLQNALTRPMRTEATRQNRSEYLSLWAGQGVRMARRQSAAELVARLGREYREALRRHQ
ncbi:MAG TPA: nitronate monooxygenase [Candidatus Limnocylindrales bacterium]|nr:nitronate monooxygenase [Candidatus Limnocylindrales bacterium]